MVLFTSSKFIKLTVRQTYVLLNGFDLSVKNPNKGGEVVLREPKEILENMNETDENIKRLMTELKRLL